MELKNTVSEMKNLLNGIERLHNAEEKISVFDSTGTELSKMKHREMKASMNCRKNSNGLICM